MVLAVKILLIICWTMYGLMCLKPLRMSFRQSWVLWRASELLLALAECCSIVCRYVLICAVWTAVNKQASVACWELVDPPLPGMEGSLEQPALERGVPAYSRGLELDIKGPFQPEHSVILFRRREVSWKRFPVKDNRKISGFSSLLTCCFVPRILIMKTTCNENCFFFSFFFLMR